MKNRIAELRKQFGLNQTQLAKKLNTTQANISSWEHGKWQPDNETLIKLSIFFHCTIDYLLCKTDVNTQQKEPETIEFKKEDNLTSEQKELLQFVAQLNDYQCKVAKVYFKTLLNDFKDENEIENEIDIQRKN